MSLAEGRNIIPAMFWKRNSGAWLYPFQHKKNLAGNRKVGKDILKIRVLVDKRVHIGIHAFLALLGNKDAAFFMCCDFKIQLPITPAHYHSIEIKKINFINKVDCLNI